MKLTSTAFEHEGWIPSKYTAYENNIISPLSWSEVPEAMEGKVIDGAVLIGLYDRT